MASDSMELFGCPFCGFRVRPTDEACPRCGNSFKDGTQFECPFCGDMVSPGAKECPSCHINFTEFMSHAEKKVSSDSIDSLLMDIIQLESYQVIKEDKKFSCPKCSWMLDGDEERCPKCGTDLTQDTALQCPICGAFVDSNSDRCSECGTVFAGDELEEARMAKDHQDISSALTDILSSAGHEGPLPDIDEPGPEPPADETAPVKESAVTTPEAPTREAVAEPPELAEEIKGQTEAPKKASQPAAPKKTKQRKLKVMPGAPKDRM